MSCLENSAVILGIGAGRIPSEMFLETVTRPVPVAFIGDSKELGGCTTEIQTGK